MRLFRVNSLGGSLGGSLGDFTPQEEGVVETEKQSWCPKGSLCTQKVPGLPSLDYCYSKHPHTVA